MRLEPRGQVLSIRLSQCHPAIEHDLAIRPKKSSGTLHELFVFLQSLFTVAWSIRKGELEFLEAEFNRLLDVVARAISRHTLPADFA